jgi:hypothetical protein
MACASLYETSDACLHIACAGSASSSVCASIGFIKVALKEEKFINKYTCLKEGGCFNFVILLINKFLAFDEKVLYVTSFKKHIF